jgi:hypothetical protein
MSRKYIWFFAVVASVLVLFVFLVDVLVGSEVYVPVYNSSNGSRGGGEISFGILSDNESILNDNETSDVPEK